MKIETLRYEISRLVWPRAGQVTCALTNRFVSIRGYDPYLFAVTLIAIRDGI
jgi:hypothetical protein